MQATTGTAYSNSNGLPFTPAVSRQVSSSLNVKDFGASGSDQSTTGSVSAGSNRLKLAAPIDFKDGEGISIAHAGTAPNITTPPEAPTVSTQVKGGSASYSYAIAYLDGKGGESAASDIATLATGNATLSGANCNHITWSKPPHGVAAVALYRTMSRGTPSNTGLLVILPPSNMSYDDAGAPILVPPIGVSQSAPTFPLADSFVSQIAAGAGTANITLSSATQTAASKTVVSHNDSASFRKVISLTRNVFIPPGTYNVNLSISKSSTLTGTGSNFNVSGAQTILKSAQPGIAPIKIVSTGTLGYIDISNLSLDGTFSSPGLDLESPAGYVITRSNFHDLSISNVTSGVILNGQDIYNNSFRHIWISNVYAFGMWIGGGAGPVYNTFSSIEITRTNTDAYSIFQFGYNSRFYDIQTDGFIFESGRDDIWVSPFIETTYAAKPPGPIGNNIAFYDGGSDNAIYSLTLQSVSAAQGLYIHGKDQTVIGFNTWGSPYPSYPIVLANSSGTLINATIEGTDYIDNYTSATTLAQWSIVGGNILKDRPPSSISSASISIPSNID
jgi:hypothetical protein